MKVNIINLTRKYIAPISSNSKINLTSINSMPEMVLNRMIKRGDKSILHVGMNECRSSVITPNGVNTIYTDALGGCNSVGAVLIFKN